MRKLLIICVLILANLSFAQLQYIKNPSSTEIYESIQKLNFLGSVLYVAAHPDDENTHLISYFANERHARTAYVSLTRGDGGQNLIGPEIRELLGVIRTQELLKARSIDGGIQFFSRANDFGFSKHPDETFEIWDRNQVLSDLVYIMRKFQPDVIINRFDHRSPGTTHGHHTASAILSVEAFDLINNPNAFPEQLNRTKTWKAQRMFFNHSWFFYGSQEKFDRADKSNLFAMDIGVFYPTLGLSNAEIAAKSRSQHSSQGFGASPTRGSSMEYLEPVFGGMPQKDVFEGIDTTWNRVKGGKPIGDLINQILAEFDFKNPSASVADLVKVYEMIQKLDDEHWKKIKSEEIKNIIQACTGLFLEVLTPAPTAVPGEVLNLKIEALNRSEIPMKLNSVMLKCEGALTEIETDSQTLLPFNQSVKMNEKFEIPTIHQLSIPYWLEQTGSLGMYRIPNENLVGLPESPQVFRADFHIDIEGTNFVFSREMIYKYNDPKRGEVYKPFVLVPEASLKMSEEVLVFSEQKSKMVKVEVKSFVDDLKGELFLNVPKDWRINPPKQSVQIGQKGAVQTYEFEVFPPKNQSEAEVIPQLQIGNRILDKQLVEIDYEHIPEQKILLPSTAKIVHIDIHKKGNKIGYIAGAGDTVAENLKQIGYEVENLSVPSITTENLSRFDAVILGVRAFNTIPELSFKNRILFDYVKNGGNLVVQYNTNHALVTDEISPLPLKLSRERVTDENSVVQFVHPNHPVLNSPNKITQADFKGWVQERGLYFPNAWDTAFVPILRMHDKGESPLEGSLLIAPYGKGHYIYTGLSFFRELPAGVPGAYRLMANLLSLGK